MFMKNYLERFVHSISTKMRFKCKYCKESPLEYPRNVLFTPEDTSKIKQNKIKIHILFKHGEKQRQQIYIHWYNVYSFSSRWLLAMQIV